MQRISFSRTFPKYHQKAGQPTYFVEKILESIYLSMPEQIDLPYLRQQFGDHVYSHGVFTPKHHTIRAKRKDGKDLKVGDKFLPVVWSGKPYASKQIVIAPPIEVKKVWEFKIRSGILLNNEFFCEVFKQESSGCSSKLTLLANNDGLSVEDFLLWFYGKKTEGGVFGVKEFDGQIICWNESINY